MIQNPMGEPMSTLRKGEHVTVKYLDGREEKVFVRQPPISQLDKYLELYGQVAAFVEFVCDKPEKWSDGLEDESVYALLEKARALNDPRLAILADQQAGMVAFLKPLMDQATALRSQSFAPTPRSR